MDAIRLGSLYSVAIVGTFVSSHFPGGPLGQSAVADEMLFPSATLRGDDPFDEFGWSVAIGDDIAIVGAPNDSDRGRFAGAAYVFDLNTGERLHKLFASDASAEDEFGRSVDISGNLAVVGAVRGTGVSDHSGSAYVFDITTGEQISKLAAEDGFLNDYFGEEVALHGNTAVVGAWSASVDTEASGSAYVFNALTGEQLFQLRPDNMTVGQSFGRDVAIDARSILVGAPGDAEVGRFAGAAYGFDRATGEQVFKLTSDDLEPGDNFGHSVDLAYGSAVIGSPGANRSADDSHAAGSAYIFDVATGTQLRELASTDFTDNDRIGEALAISDNRIVVGARGHDSPDGRLDGSVFLFDLSGEQLATLTARNLQNPMGVPRILGGAVDIFGNYVVASAEGGPFLGVGRPAFLYRIPEPSTAQLALLGFAFAVLLAQGRKGTGCQVPFG